MYDWFILGVIIFPALALGIIILDVLDEYFNNLL